MTTPESAIVAGNGLSQARFSTQSVLERGTANAVMRIARTVTMARLRTHFETGVCKICGNETQYDSRAGRMPVACEKDACKRKARRQGRKKRSPNDWVKGGINEEVDTGRS